MRCGLRKVGGLASVSAFIELEAICNYRWDKGSFLDDIFNCQ